MVHCVWGTKNRAPILQREKREALFQHILANARNKDIFIDMIGGHADHVHCLISLGAEQNMSKVVNLIKGESSHWANSTALLAGRLEWADEYFAGSVSESSVDAVRAYIKNQEEHHRKMTFAEEYNTFIERYGMRLG
jgi:REP element-mobilizing transposase RayT